MKRLGATLLLLLAAVLSAAAARAEPFTDSAERVVEVPAHVDRVMAAGPPAAVALYVVAPEKLAGWVRQPTAPELALLAPDAGALPTIGRITGHGDTTT